MAKLVFEMQQSLDGYVDHQKMGPPRPALFHHFVERVRNLQGMAYGGRMYEIMRYWDDDLPEWDAQEREFADAWRKQPKWVVSRSSKSVGPNAALISNNFEKVLRELKTKLTGEIGVGGPHLAGLLTSASLIDEYRVYIRPVVLGSGQTFFVGTPPALRLVANDLIVEDVVRLTYVPA